MDSMVKPQDFPVCRLAILQIPDVDKVNCIDAAKRIKMFLLLLLMYLDITIYVFIMLNIWTQVYPHTCRLTTGWYLSGLPVDLRLAGTCRTYL
jgi:hypothetical protein